MNSPKEQEVFHPSSVPVNRAKKQREGRKRSCQCCFYVATVLFALLGAVVVLGGGYLIAKLTLGFLFPLRDLALPHKHTQPFNASQLHPLINSQSTFDIHATVLEDVTDLLARGEKLPDDQLWQTYEQTLNTRDTKGVQSNFTRTDVVVWSGKVIEGATIDSKIHTSIPLRIPVQPLYTNKLGRSSLRAIFSVSIPDEQAKTLGTFFNVSYILSDRAPILPKRSNYAHWPTDLNTALIDAGISTSLLELVPSPFYRTDSEGSPVERTIDNRSHISPFFDRHPRNLHFLQASSDQVNQAAEGRLPEYRNGDARILIPHFRTRSRVGLVKSKDAFVYDDAMLHQFEGKHRLMRTCNNLDSAECERPYWKHAFESLFTFTRADSEDHVDDKDTGRTQPDVSAAAASAVDSKKEQKAHFYGPVLTQVSTPAASQFLRRIPQRAPTIDGAHEPQIVRTNASAACAIPAASLDASRQYFEFDWQIYFSSHTLRRVLLAESSFPTIVWSPPLPLGPGEEGDREIAANSVPTEAATHMVGRLLTGDRLHSKDHPTPLVIGSTMAVIWHFFFDEILLIWFWYTRRTSTGLWIEAQWTWIVIVMLKFAVELADYVTAGQEGSIILLLYSGSPLIHVIFMVTTLLHLKRPADYTGFWSNPLAFRRRRLTRREVKSINLAKSIDKRPFYVLSAALVLICLGNEYWISILNPAERCVLGDTDVKVSLALSRRMFQEATQALTRALLQTQLLAQAYFNNRSSTFTGCFRISAIGTAALASFEMLVECLALFSSWADQRHTSPIRLYDFVELALLIPFAYQAVRYKGVPQVEVEDEDEE
ncbi:hypothetical protein EX895_002254 [Sporisorium graminicola]|uniref:Uncharacterized protein n=1 Tax=Sporisorium graminicola TaxID=280036 RepID=A0A4U7KWK6_9BASI|nr:hypothetical protein EX895_002254 [Sporisorium graminicola]TKY89013.1 hypothetical protein EX895_002254 [Sporisorium graminicola]